MSDLTIQNALAILNGAPGPAPWYATEPPARDGEFLYWCSCSTFLRDSGALANANLLIDHAQAVFLVLPPYTYAQLVKPSRLLCWMSSSDSVVFRLFNTAAFNTPVAKSIVAARDAVGPGKMAWASGLVWEADIPRPLDGERRSLEFPSDLEGVAEVLALALRPRTTQLYQLLPKEGILAIYPQRWFDEGSYDFGYQWPQTVTRDRVSRAVFGSGVRLGVFVLDSTLCGVKAWLQPTPAEQANQVKANALFQTVQKKIKEMHSSAIDKMSAEQLTEIINNYIDELFQCEENAALAQYISVFKRSAAVLIRNAAHLRTIK